MDSPEDGAYQRWRDAEECTDETSCGCSHVWETVTRRLRALCFTLQLELAHHTDLAWVDALSFVENCLDQKLSAEERRRLAFHVSRTVRQELGRLDNDLLRRTLQWYYRLQPAAAAQAAADGVDSRLQREQLLRAAYSRAIVELSRYDDLPSAAAATEPDESIARQLAELSDVIERAGSVRSMSDVLRDIMRPPARRHNHLRAPASAVTAASANVAGTDQRAARQAPHSVNSLRGSGPWAAVATSVGEIQPLLTPDRNEQRNGQRGAWWAPPPNRNSNRSDADIQPLLARQHDQLQLQPEQQPWGRRSLPEAVDTKQPWRRPHPSFSLLANCRGTAAAMPFAEVSRSLPASAYYNLPSPRRATTASARPFGCLAPTTSADSGEQPLQQTQPTHHVSPFCWQAVQASALHCITVAAEAAEAVGAVPTAAGPAPTAAAERATANGDALSHSVPSCSSTGGADGMWSSLSEPNGRISISDPASSGSCAAPGSAVAAAAAAEWGRPVDFRPHSSLNKDNGYWAAGLRALAAPAAAAANDVTSVRDSNVFWSLKC